MHNVFIYSMLAYFVSLVLCCGAFSEEASSPDQPPLTEKQKAPGGVQLAEVKIPETQKSVDLCPVHLVPSNPKLETWTYGEVAYCEHRRGCYREFRKAPDEYAEKAASKRWENNFIAVMSMAWCPLMGNETPSSDQKKWVVDGIAWQSCCEFCDEIETTDEDFAAALELLKERALVSYTLTKGKYAEESTARDGDKKEKAPEE